MIPIRSMPAMPPPLWDNGHYAAPRGREPWTNCVKSEAGSDAGEGQRQGAVDGGPQVGHLEDLLLVERLALEQRLGQGDQASAVLAQQSVGDRVAFLDDAPHLFVDQLGSRLAVGLALIAGWQAVVPG